MPKLTLDDFGGIIPVSGDRALPPNFAVESINTWFYGKELRGLRPPIQLQTVALGTRKVLRIPTLEPPSDVTKASTWVQFADPDTDIVKGALIEDSYKRWYFCSPSTGPMFNTYARLAAGNTMYRLGVPGPDTTYTAAGTNADTPTIVSITGGVAPVVTRAFVYTWVNEFGEESAPSLPVTGAGNANAIWDIGNIKDPPTPAADQPAWSKKYLYRTITGASGQTTFYRVNTIALGTLTYADNGAQITDAVLANNLTLESTTWQPPPVDLKGIIAMPNGFLIGWKDNTIYMSEAYHWHAWPAEYKYATETPIVGVGVIGQTCVVCTQGYPATITGSTPATCAFTKATTGEPCLKRGSIVSTPQGVIYSSQNGLMLVSAGGMDNVTQALISKDDWAKFYKPETLRAVRYQNGYLAMMENANYPVDKNDGFFLDPTELKVALTDLSDFEDVLNVMNDFWSGEVFLLQAGSGSNKILCWDKDVDEVMPVQWLSKEFQFPYVENFGCYAIFWDAARWSDTTWGTGILPVDEAVRVKVYADRVEIYNEEVPVNGLGVRLPSGFKAAIWQFEILSRAPVYAMHVASTMKELRDV